MNAIENAAKTAHEVNRAYCAGLGDDSQVPWDEAPGWQRESAIEGARAIQADPDRAPSASHDGWMAHKLADGWVYGETKDAEKKTHPCLVAFDELPPEQQAKDILFAVAVRGCLAGAQ